jgi:hypothetical protein
MIKHIVLWKLDQTYSSDEITEIKKQIKEKLLNLKNVIKSIKSIEVNLNIDRTAGENYDIILVTLFDLIEDLYKYQRHPAHLKVVNFLKSLKLQRTAIDIEC